MLSIIYITSRDDPKLEWMLDSLALQNAPEHEVIVVAKPNCKLPPPRKGVKYVEPKPSVWSGPHRLTKADMWAASNARNTGICHANYDWLLFLDDRSVLLPKFMDQVANAITGKYVLCGTYEKVNGLEVDNGKVVGYQRIDCNDSRATYCDQFFRHIQPPYPAYGSWVFGCALVCPTEWALRVGGFEESCDGISGEDTAFGLMLHNHGYPIYFSPDMKILEDRTPALSGPTVIRYDKGKSPSDKSHALVDKTKNLRHVILPKDIQSIRKQLKETGTFPVPTEPTKDWYDDQPLKDMPNV
jgi:hypothetical protein